MMDSMVGYMGIIALHISKKRAAAKTRIQLARKKQTKNLRNRNFFFPLALSPAFLPGEKFVELVHRIVYHPSPRHALFLSRRLTCILSI